MIFPFSIGDEFLGEKNAVHFQGNLHPGRLTWNPTNQPFRKENDLNQASIFVEFHVNLPGCCIQPREIFWDDKEIPSRFQQPSAHPPFP